VTKASMPTSYNPIQGAPARNRGAPTGSRVNTTAPVNKPCTIDTPRRAPARSQVNTSERTLHNRSTEEREPPDPDGIKVRVREGRQREGQEEGTPNSLNRPRAPETSMMASQRPRLNSSHRRCREEAPRR
jgi:hypothetical protein